MKLIAMFLLLITTPFLSFLGTVLWVVLCGRYTVAIDPRVLIQLFNAEVADPIQPRYNAAPGQDLPVILNSSPNKIQLCRWGLIPHWAKEADMGYSLINARAETVMENRMFRSSFHKRRCLVLADGFYEWQKTGRKTPYRIVLQNEDPFAFAGIWSRWKDANEHNIYSFSIITTEANAVVAQIHDRMPVILQPQDVTNWLTIPPAEAVNLLQPYPDHLMRAYPVSPRVNSPANDDPDVIKPRKLRRERLRRLDEFFS